MKTNGKISHLPHEIREQLNLRLDNGEQAKPILDWLHALPEVQAVLTARFDGRRITKQNVSEWKQNGFRNWQMRHSALQFVQDLDGDQSGAPELLTGSLTAKLAHWVALRYAAAAHALSSLDDDPETELRRLREFCSDIVALRRGDLSAGRLTVEQARLAAEQSDTDQEREKAFWSWIKRPEIQAKLYPDRNPDQVRTQVVDMISRELLGIHRPLGQTAQPDPDPAILI